MRLDKHALHIELSAIAAYLDAIAFDFAFTAVQARSSRDGSFGKVLGLVRPLGQLLVVGSGRRWWVRRTLGVLGGTIGVVH